MTYADEKSTDVVTLESAYRAAFATLEEFGGFPEIVHTGGGIHAIEDTAGQAFNVPNVVEGAQLYLLATNGEPGLLFPTDERFGSTRWLVGIYEAESGDQVCEADDDSLEVAYSQAFANLHSGAHV